MILRLFFVIVLSISFLGLEAQDVELDGVSDKKIERKNRDRYLGIGGGSAFIKSRDEATSPLLYKGLQLAAANLSYFEHSKKVIKTLEVDFSYGFLSTRTETPWYDPTNTSYLVVTRYNQVYPMKTQLPLNGKWYLGPEINYNGHFRVNYKYGNSALTFDNYAGIGLASRIEIPLSYDARKVKIWFMNFNRRDRDLRFSWQLSTPVYSVLVRPSYVTITNFIDPELQSAITEDHLDNGFFIPFNLRSQTELYYLLHNQNMLRLAYVWNFYHYANGYNKSQTAYHGFLFSFLFKFNHKDASQ